ncbi:MULTISPECIES: GPW/gp25 family protein [Streptosporangium]|uniref:Phage baseplate assembly protein W n=1 Tax=Streptosporangium brasiliense TaxID=47480 RepID=A0ABT9RMD5_9ACTN|nr:GPW/gp25 family protein [Streptosporangium brasiliense]MDP9870463.1 phage baseplate assembly protein W [Streptosporangium brasiliense]
MTTTRNVDRQILQRLVTIIATNPTERVMMPEFGVGVARMVFEPDPSTVVADLSIDVAEQAALYEPGAVITKLTPYPEPSKGMALLDVGFKRTDTPDSGVAASRFVHRGVVGPGGTVSEVIRG